MDESKKPNMTKSTEIAPYSSEDFDRELAVRKAEIIRSTKEKIAQQGELAARSLYDQLEYTDAEYIRGFLNNFPGHMPGGYKRRGLEEIAEEEWSEDMKKKSKLHQDLDAAIVALGLNVSEIEKIVRERKIKENIDLIKRIYVEMRRRGYKHYPDLVG
jgi:hypothetical protein